MSNKETQQKLLDNILLKVNDFPTLPTIYSKLSDTINNPTCSAQDVANVISQDQASVSKILKVANSSVYGFVRKVTAIEQAVVYIGFQQIKSLVLALSVIKLFENVKELKNISPEGLWRYSFAVGAISRNIAKTCGEKVVEDYFVAGIIHGIGKLLFMITIPQIYEKIIQNVKVTNEHLHLVERKVLGISHMKVAEMLGEKWKLPKTLCNALGNYHVGFVDGRFHLLSSIIHISTITSSMLELGDPGGKKVPVLNKDIWEHLNLPEDFFTKHYPIFYKEYQEMCSLLLNK